MISEKYLKHLQNELTNIENDGLYKRERIITSQQSAEIVANGKSLLNFCANNYLGLSNHPEVMKASQDMIELLTVTECLRCVLSAELRIFTKNWKPKFQNF